MFFIGRRSEKGDTLIEVLFAVTVFSLVMVSSLTIMNQGILAAQRSVEITQVRQQIDGQAEAIRYLHDAYIASYVPGSAGPLSPAATQWAALVAGSSVASPSTFGSQGNGTVCTQPPNRSFIVNPRTARYVASPSFVNNSPTQTYAKLNFDPATGAFTNSNGLWVEAVRSATSSDPAQARIGYIDFHIRACWASPGTSNLMTLGTIVRLYEPR